MCLAVPAKIIEKTGNDAVVELQGVRRTCSLMLLPDAVVGDWVIMHAGFALETLDEESAAETLKLIAQLEPAE